MNFAVRNSFVRPVHFYICSRRNFSISVPFLCGNYTGGDVYAVSIDYFVVAVTFWEERNHDERDMLLDTSINW